MVFTGERERERELLYNLIGLVIISILITIIIRISYVTNNYHCVNKQNGIHRRERERERERIAIIS